MISIINAGNFLHKLIHQNLSIYGTELTSKRSAQSIKEALSIFQWRDYFKPFAQVIVDQHAEEIVLVRDHLGIRPLYYWYKLGRLIFADNIPAIIQQLPSPPVLMESALLNLFSCKNLYSDETIYQGIYRVEPGHIIHIASNGHVTKNAFWALEREGEELHYQKDMDYLDHFSSLMQESLQNSVKGYTNIAAEFSAGMDSCAVYCAAAKQGVKAKLYLHDAIPGSAAALRYNTEHERKFIELYKLRDIKRIDDTNFDPIHVFKKYATWFAGPSPFIFDQMAHNVHQAVSFARHELLLSGFGGDQGVSHHAPVRFIIPSLLRKKKYLEAWRELTSSTPKNDFFRNVYHFSKYFRTSIAPLENPYQNTVFSSLREAEWSFLQGPFSQEIRMRIEYSSVVSQHFGFEYRYPLLYPKLLEFFLSLPVAQKRRNGAGRFLLRRYLAQQDTNDIFDDYQKRCGLDIAPAAMNHIRNKYEQGHFKLNEKESPYARLVSDEGTPMTMITTLQAFMLDSYYTNRQNSINHSVTASYRSSAPS